MEAVPDLPERGAEDPEAVPDRTADPVEAEAGVGVEQEGLGAGLGGEPLPASEETLEGIAAKSARRRLNARDEALALHLAQTTLLTGRAGVSRVLALAGSLPWVVLVNASSAAWSGLKPTARAQFLKGIGTVPGEGFVRTRMSIIRGLWKADAGAASKAVAMLFKDLVDKTTGLLPAREAIQFGNVFLGRGRPWIASADISGLKEAEQEIVRLGIFSACVQTPQAPPVVIYAMRVVVEAHLTGKLTAQQVEYGEKAVAKLSAKWQRTLGEEVPGLPEIFRAKTNIRGEAGTSADPREGKARETETTGEDGEGGAAMDGHQKGSSASGTSASEAGPAEVRRERPVYVSKTIPMKGDGRSEERRTDDRRAEEREFRDDRGRRGRESQPEPRKAAGPFNPAEALRQLDTYIQGLRVELNAAQVRLRQRDEDARRKRPERRSAAVPGDQSAEELYRQVRQLELRNAELQARIEEFRAASEVRGVSRGLVDGSVPEDAATELRRALSVTLRDDFEDFEALKRDAQDVVVQRYFGSLLQHIFEVLRDEGVVFEGLTPGVETKEQIIESQAALKSVDIVPLVLDDPDDDDLEELDALDAKAEDLEEPASELEGEDAEDHHVVDAEDEGDEFPEGILEEESVQFVGAEPAHPSERAFSEEPAEEMSSDREQGDEGQGWLEADPPAKDLAGTMTEAEQAKEDVATGGSIEGSVPDISVTTQPLKRRGSRARASEGET